MKKHYSYGMIVLVAHASTLHADFTFVIPTLFLTGVQTARKILTGDKKTINFDKNDSSYATWEQMFSQWAPFAGLVLAPAVVAGIILSQKCATSLDTMTQPTVAPLMYMHGSLWALSGMMCYGVYNHIDRSARNYNSPLVSKKGRVLRGTIAGVLFWTALCYVRKL